jgi:hypothetical protein
MQTCRAARPGAASKHSKFRARTFVIAISAVKAFPVAGLESLAVYDALSPRECWLLLAVLDVAFSAGRRKMPHKLRPSTHYPFASVSEIIRLVTHADHEQPIQANFTVDFACTCGCYGRLAASTTSHHFSLRHFCCVTKFRILRASRDKSAVLNVSVTELLVRFTFSACFMDHHSCFKPVRLTLGLLGKPPMTVRSLGKLDEAQSSSNTSRRVLFSDLLTSSRPRLRKAEKYNGCSFT